MMLLLYALTIARCEYLNYMSAGARHRREWIWYINFPKLVRSIEKDWCTFEPFLKKFVADRLHETSHRSWERTCYNAHKPDGLHITSLFEVYTMLALIELTEQTPCHRQTCWDVWLLFIISWAMREFAAQVDDKYTHCSSLFLLGLLSWLLMWI